MSWAIKNVINIIYQFFIDIMTYIMKYPDLLLFVIKVIIFERLMLTEFLPTELEAGWVLTDAALKHRSVKDRQ